MYDKLYASLFEIVSLFNRPKQDKALVGRAGVSLDTALFPLLMRIAMLGPVGVVALSEQVDRDHSTVSRQVDKLIAQGLVAVHTDDTDRRIRLLVTTEHGQAIVRQIAETRRLMMDEALRDWSDDDIAELAAVLCRLSETLQRYSTK